MGGATMYHFSLITAALVRRLLSVDFFSADLLLKNGLFRRSVQSPSSAGWLNSGYVSGVYYLQYVPQRLLFPSIFLLLCSLQLTAKKQARKNGSRA
jgi:hypothetical protein